MQTGQRQDIDKLDDRNVWLLDSATDLVGSAVHCKTAIEATFQTFSLFRCVPLLLLNEFSFLKFGHPTTNKTFSYAQGAVSVQKYPHVTTNIKTAVPRLNELSNGLSTCGFGQCWICELYCMFSWRSTKPICLLCGGMNINWKCEISSSKAKRGVVGVKRAGVACL